MKVIYSVTLALTAAALLAIGVPAYANKADDKIEAAAKNSYAFKTILKDENITVKSQNGIVALTGSAESKVKKSLAEETVAGLPGVKKVDNQLEVKYSSPGSPAEKADMWLTTQVRTVLLFHKNVSSLTEVSTKDSIVTLRGEVSTQAEKNLTGEYAQDVDGVKGVKNEMTISPKPKMPAQTTGEQIDDASITSQVKIVLLYHRSTSAIKTSVATKRGVVTLTGTAKNEAERDLATKYAEDVKGVKSVKNQMTIVR
jgi:osmotically-inducible protein OsmY